MATIGLSMIVKNGGEDLRACLESVKGVVDQIVIADTGSTDNTRETAAAYGAEIITIPWEEHFANARNRGLEAMKTDWVLVLDPDEALEEGASQLIHALVRETEGVGGFQVPIQNFFRERFVLVHGRLATGVTNQSGRAKGAQSHGEHRACRLFRHLPGIRYSGRIHELVEYSIEALGMRVEPANFTILHYGQLAGPDIRQKKNQFYRRLLQLKVEEEPNNPAAWFELGSLEQVRFHNNKGALHYLYRAAEIAPHLAEPWVRISQIHAEEGERELALQALQKLERDGERQFFVNYQKGDLLHDLGRLSEARTAYKRALTQCPAMGDYAQAVQSKLGYTEVRLGRMKSGFYKLRRAVELSPDNVENHDRLMKGYISAGDLASAAEAAEAVLKRFVSEKRLVRAAALRIKLRQKDRARRLTDAGLRLFPASASLLEMQSQLQPGYPEPGPDQEHNDQI